MGFDLSIIRDNKEGFQASGLILIVEAAINLEVES